jgi:hypothetical protein
MGHIRDPEHAKDKAQPRSDDEQEHRPAQTDEQVTAQGSHRNALLGLHWVIFL